MFKKDEKNEGHKGGGRNEKNIREMEKSRKD